jgi:hypothetical protein
VKLAILTTNLSESGCQRENAAIVEFADASSFDGQPCKAWLVETQLVGRLGNSFLLV